MNDYWLRDKEFNRRQLQKILITIFAVLTALLFVMWFTRPSLAMAQDPSLVGLWHMNVSPDTKTFIGEGSCKALSTQIYNNCKASGGP